MKLRVSISSFLSFCSALGATAQDARFKPVSIGVTLDNPSYLVDFNSASGTARWVHYELQGGKHQVVRAGRTISELTGVLRGTRRRLLRTAGRDTTAVI